jgi:hypothetical protein
MSEWQTESDFAGNLNTKFRVQLDEAESIDLTLVAVTSRPSGPNEQAGMERFSAVFSGPPDFFLPQRTYHMVHPQMGEFDVFLVVIGKEADAYRYEAVYNFFKPN